MREILLQFPVFLCFDLDIFGPVETGVFAKHYFTGLQRLRHGKDFFTHTVGRHFNIPAEQFFQTNFLQGPSADRSLWRGGMNLWNPSWIITHVLWQAIEMNKRGY